MNNYLFDEKFSCCVNNFIFAASCAAPVAIINTTPDIDTIQLCASYDPMVPAELRKELNFGLEKFIIDYNLSAPLIKVSGCVNENNPQTINLLIQNQVGRYIYRRTS